MTRRELLLTLPAAAAAQTPSRIRYINLAHFSHRDFGFTDHPTVTRELARRFLDVAIDTCLAKPGFAWTVETLDVATDWWDANNDARRQDLLRTIAAGNLEIAALPFNNTPFMNGEQWDTALTWASPKLWEQFRPRAAIQNDVNGIPRAAAVRLLDRGVSRLFMGINSDSGGAPFPRHTRFWWRMPDGRRIFVWLGDHYGSGFGYFAPAEWRRGPVPRAGDARYHPPRPGEIFRADEPSLRQAHALLTRRLEKIPYDRAFLTFTNEWRMDNDPPFPALSDFVEAWNRLSLQPELRLVTASRALEDMERAAGPTAPEYSGEWTDWWANGTASAPREVAASRAAKRTLRSVVSPVFGTADADLKSRVHGLYKQLCLFDEHTWGSSLSVALPDSLDSAGQFAAKAQLAYEPMGVAEWILGQRQRVRLDSEPEGLYVTNPTSLPYTGWVHLPASALREGSVPFFFENGLAPFGRPRSPEEVTRENPSAVFADNAPRQVARFWVNELAPHSFQRIEPNQYQAPAPASERPITALDTAGWPTEVTWRGMPKPLFLAGLGDFTSIEATGFAPRAAAEADRGRLRTVPPQYSRVSASESPWTSVYVQEFEHSRLRWASRRLEIWKSQPRARLTVRLYRLSSANPEVFYIDARFPLADTLPEVSSGDVPFTPFRDQLPGTCRDFFAIDGWARYSSPDGQWLWVSRDAPLVSLGGPHLLERIEKTPPDPNRISAMVFNNFWYTNFVADQHGVMEFQFDLAWRPPASVNPDQWSDALLLDPPVMINPAERESPVMRQRLFR